MIVSDNFIYLQMHKTACTKIGSLFIANDGGVAGRKHDRLNETDPSKTILSSIRNPLDWYVSLWAYGCAGKGTLYNLLVPPDLSTVAKAQRARNYLSRLTHWHPIGNDTISIETWRRLYSDAENYEHFREWLYRLHNANVPVRLTDRFCCSNARADCGLMSFRFLRMVTLRQTWQRNSKSLKTPAMMLAFFDKYAVPTGYIRMEHIERDMRELLATEGLDWSSLSDDVRQRVNVSNHRHFDDYYDEAARQFVYNRDKLVFSRFGYAI